MDANTGKVLLAAAVNFADWAAGLEAGLRIVIAVLTVIYILRKLRRLDPPKGEDLLKQRQLRQIRKAEDEDDDLI